jgi:hypothetical protein
MFVISANSCGHSGKMYACVVQNTELLTTMMSVASININFMGEYLLSYSMAAVG